MYSIHLKVSVKVSIIVPLCFKVLIKNLHVMGRAVSGELVCMQAGLIILGFQKLLEKTI